ncbi:MAG: hypothetical protein PHY43_15080 [Verrucomicrobiales bacterium]|nr:hypothetical protein [Verrucomicrobiales bacterium]
MPSILRLISGSVAANGRGALQAAKVFGISHGQIRRKMIHTRMKATKGK